MKITIRGVRGSIPTSGPDTDIYGGNTSSTLVFEDGWLLVLDGGSGLQQFKNEDKQGVKRIDVLLTHLHLDHIQGLGFFKALFEPGMEIHIYGPASSANSLHSRLSKYLSPPLFPVRIRDLPCDLTLHEVENTAFDIGPFKINSGYVIHSGPTVGFRIESRGAVFTYIPDHEPALGPAGMINDVKWISGIDLALNADVLLHDAQYTTSEYKQRLGWGHSSMHDALQFAAVAGVKRLLLGHHDPSHTDAKLEAMLADVKNKSEYPFPFELAKEGMTIEI
jgi:ribonuclease BN (tRNA processing enzyme)